MIGAESVVGAALGRPGFTTETGTASGLEFGMGMTTLTGSESAADASCVGIGRPTLAAGVGAFAG